MNGVVRLPPGPALARARANAAYAFLRGPIPWSWLVAAAACPGRALHVALAIRYHSGRARSLRIALSLSKIARTFGFDRTTASRGLDSLVGAKLVAVERYAGKKPVITIVEICESDHAFVPRSPRPSNRATKRSAPARLQPPGAWSEPTARSEHEDK
jgi:hypothetical protein